MIPFQSHKMHSIIFSDCKLAFALIEGISPRLDHENLCLKSCPIHFSSPITIRFKNRSTSLRFNKESQEEIQSIKFFSINSCGTHLSALLTISSWRNHFNMNIGADSKKQEFLRSLELFYVDHFQSAPIFRCHQPHLLSRMWCIAKIKIIFTKHSEQHMESSTASLIVYSTYLFFFAFAKHSCLFENKKA